MKTHRPHSGPARENITVNVSKDGCVGLQQTSVTPVHHGDFVSLFLNRHGKPCSRTDMWTYKTLRSCCCLIVCSAISGSQSYFSLPEGRSPERVLFFFTDGDLFSLWEVWENWTLVLFLVLFFALLPTKNTMHSRFRGLHGIVYFWLLSCSHRRWTSCQKEGTVLAGDFWTYKICSWGFLLFFCF